MNIETDTRWKTFYKVAGTAALLIVLVGLVDTITSMMGGEARGNSTISVVEWFTMFQTSRFSALSALGIFNNFTLSLGIHVYIELYHPQRDQQPGFAMLAALLFFMGTAIYVSSNTIFSMLALSSQYAAAAEAQKPLIEAAGRAALAQGADLTPGTFMGFFFTQTAGVLMALLMLLGKVFGKWTGWIGLAGYVIMLIFFVLTAFAPESFATAMMIAMVGGLLLMAYQIMLGRRLFQLAGK